jgi:PTH1 family peptidyl-tRNA hydrolase
MLRRILHIRGKSETEAISLIVGLGNPGMEHSRNRHNVGFQVLDRLARRHDLVFERMEFQGLVARGTLAGEAVILVKPLSFMNRSGRVVKPIMSRYGIGTQRLLVIYDDLDLPLGKIRIRPHGGSGGHRGLESIVASIGTDGFPRVRVGIGRPDGPSPEEYVLRDFSVEESITMEEAYEKAILAVERYIDGGIDAAMNLYN